MILITGPTSNSGSMLLELLIADEAQIRCMPRRGEVLTSLRERGIEAEHGDYDDPATLDVALDGVAKAFLVCTPDRQLQGRETRFIDACVRNGVEHVVCLGGMPVPGADSPVLAAHSAVEAHLEKSGLGFTLVRPLGFMQTVYWMSLPTIQNDGALVGAVGDGRNAQVDLRDVVQVIFKSLTQEGHAGRKYDITGPEALTMSEVAAILSPAVGRELEYQDMPLEVFAEGLRKMKVPEFSLRHILSVFEKIRKGRLAQVTETLVELGIEAHSWSDFADAVAAGRATTATSH